MGKGVRLPDEKLERGGWLAISYLQRHEVEGG